MVDELYHARYPSRRIVWDNNNDAALDVPDEEQQLAFSTGERTCDRNERL